MTLKWLEYQCFRASGRIYDEPLASSGDSTKANLARRA